MSFSHTSFATCWACCCDTATNRECSEFRNCNLVYGQLLCAKPLLKSEKMYVDREKNKIGNVCVM